MFFGDIHITERDIPEITDIFSEILILKDKYSISGIIITGDSFDTTKPTSKELDFFSNFLRKLNTPVTILAANSHESTTPEESVLNHFGILHDKVFICKEYIDAPHLFVGHFGIKESLLTYGGTVSKSDLKQYQNVILGHFHNHELIKPNIMQLGSVRWVYFGEDPNIPKKVAICHNYNSGDKQWSIIDLKSPYPMINIELYKNNDFKESKATILPKNVQPASPGKESQAQINDIPNLLAYLDKLYPKTKVRVIFKDYSLYREFLPYSTKYKEMFFLFKERKDFVLDIALKSPQSETTSLKDSLIKYMDINKVPEEIKQTLLKEIK